ncbi:MAG: hypothetical protein KDA61_05910 [Planctomycetales bacterium]|nr:hypothetical protein [Planctomycetales bacterium]
MFTFPIRILLILVAAGYGTFQVTTGHRAGFALIAAAGLLAFGYFRYGPIRPAFAALMRGEVDRAERMIATVRFPNLLNSQSRAYFYWIRGLIEAQYEDGLATAMSNLQAALDCGVRTSNDRCLLVATLADLTARANDVHEASRLLDEARGLPHSDGVDAYLDKLEQVIPRDS